MKNTSKACKILLIAVSLLIILGVVMQYSASSYIALRDYGDEFFYMKKQLLAVVAGGVAFFAAVRIKVEFYSKFRVPILILSVVALALVFIPFLGIEKYGATRWLNLGFTTVQPSEFAKFALMFYMAAELSKECSGIKSILKCVAAGAAVCVLIMLEPNLSITVCVGVCMLVMLFVGGMRLKHFLAIGAPCAAALPLLIVLEPYRLKRLMAFIDPWSSPLGEGYQLIQSYYALGAGGLWGVGLFNSRQKYAFLPFAESDFIFSVVGEELGLMGAVGVIGLFFCVIWCGIKIARKARDKYGAFLAVGITAVIAVQSMLNIAVVSGSVPPTGLPLPFVSAGGSSLMVFMFAAGVLVKIDSDGLQAHKSTLSHKMY